MDFGRLSIVDGVDFSLPPFVTPAGLHARPVRPTGIRPTRIILGTPTWAAPDFARHFYARGTKTTDHARLYSRCFDALELNSTFYALPSRAVAQHWTDTTSSHFRFCPKMPRSITHERQLRDACADFEAFQSALAPLKNKLGMVFMQLPPHFSYGEGAILKDFLTHVPHDFPLAIEFRHESWFSKGRVRDNVADYLRSLGRSLVVADVAGRRDVCHSSLAAPRAFVRMHGNALHPTDFTRLKAWADRLVEWSEAGAEEVYFFLHQTQEHFTLDLAAAFVPLLAERGFGELPNVNAWREGRQEALF